MVKRINQALPDVLAAVGLASVAVGLWWISPAVSLIAVGAIVMAAGFLLGRHK